MYMYMYVYTALPMYIPCPNGQSALSGLQFVVLLVRTFVVFASSFCSLLFS